jgi:hypothetical protein
MYEVLLKLCTPRAFDFINQNLPASIFSDQAQNTNPQADGCSIECRPEKFTTNAANPFERRTHEARFLQNMNIITIIYKNVPQSIYGMEGTTAWIETLPLGPR